MKFGIHLPNFSPLGGREPTIRVARRAEELGFDSLWTSDHVIMPERVESRYPYSRTGAFSFDASINYTDPFITLAVAAGCTERVELGITVLILPLRDPIVTAKMLSSLDMLSGGRVLLAAGVGWMREEFEALNLPYFDQRGKVTDEWIAIFRACWEQDVPSYEGDHYRFEPIHFNPKPTRRIPIWIGGASPAAYRRAGRIGDGWHPARATIEELVPAMDQVREHARAAGRDPERLELTMGCVVDVLDDGAGVRQPSRDLIGTAAGIAAHIRRLEGVGMTHLALDFRAGTSLEGMIEMMETFADRVRPLL